MNGMLDWQVLLSMAIIIMFGIAIWRGGQANPVGTRQILDKLVKHDARLRNVEKKMEGTASDAALGVLTTQMRALEQHAASSGEVVALEGQVAALRAETAARLDGIEKASDRTEAGVQRIEGYFLQKGINGQ